VYAATAVQHDGGCGGDDDAHAVGAVRAGAGRDGAAAAAVGRRAQARLYKTRTPYVSSSACGSTLRTYLQQQMAQRVWEKAESCYSTVLFSACKIHGTNLPTRWGCSGCSAPATPKKPKLPQEPQEQKQEQTQTLPTLPPQKHTMTQCLRNTSIIKTAPPEVRVTNSVRLYGMTESATPNMISVVVPQSAPRPSAPHRRRSQRRSRRRRRGPVLSNRKRADGR
jgi:hypothetical protein